MDITCHDASVLNPLLGALPSDVVALAATQGPWGAAAEDAVMSTLRYADGTLVQTHDAFTIPYSPTGLQVLGSDGSIEATGAMVQDPIGTILLRDSSGEREVEPEDRRDLYEINVAAFAAAVRGEGAPDRDGPRRAACDPGRAGGPRGGRIRASRVDHGVRRNDAVTVGRASRAAWPRTSWSRRTGVSVDRDAICRFLEQVPIDHATLQFCERFDEQSRIWNFDTHSHPYFELIFFIEGKANIDAGAETVNVFGFDVVIYPPGLLHAEHLELGRRQEIICFWVDTGPTPTFDHAIKLMDERGTLRELFEMVYAEFTANRPYAAELISRYLQAIFLQARQHFTEPSREASSLVERCLGYIHENYALGLRHRRPGGHGLGQSELPVPALQEEDAADADALSQRRAHRQGEAPARGPIAHGRCRRRACRIRRPQVLRSRLQGSRRDVAVRVPAGQRRRVTSRSSNSGPSDRATTRSSRSVSTARNPPLGGPDAGRLISSTRTSSPRWFAPARSNST